MRKRIYQIKCRMNQEEYKRFLEKVKASSQTVVAVHRDKDHIHCHLVTNSVSYEDGHKLHNSKKDMKRMKQLTNQMCKERSLT
ncbi:MAG: relaxase/mobilization nuclease domain-containing protein, partial [Lachnospiraceae bacterium]|nr:relaxase/mobilization nuclease domain-containing protein [Lachnospiraceae bacterium]